MPRLDLTDLEQQIVDRVRESPGCTRGEAGIGGDIWLSSRGRAYRYQLVQRLVARRILRDEGTGSRARLFVVERGRDDRVDCVRCGASVRPTSNHALACPHWA